MRLTLPSTRPLRVPRVRPALSALACAVALLCSGCAVVAVADAAVTVVSTTVKVGATVGGTPVDVGAASVLSVLVNDEE